jgi:hypothetical protein
MKFVLTTFLLNWYNLTLHYDHKDFEAVRKFEKRYIRPIDVIAIKGDKSFDGLNVCEIVLNDNQLHDVHGYCRDFAFKLNRYAQ